MQIIKDCYNLLRCIGRPGLLTIPESCICNPDILRHIMWYNSVIKRYLGNFRIREHISKYIGLFHIVQNVHMLFYFQKIVLMVHCDRTILKCFIFSHLIHPPYRQSLILLMLV